MRSANERCSSRSSLPTFPARAGATKRPIHQPTAKATTAAQTILTTVKVPPSKGSEINTASRLNSGVATRKLIAAEAGTPCATNVL